MIHTSKQLKDLVRNLSKGNSMQAQILIRNYMMERFLERLSRSPYRENFILKGGALVSAMAVSYTHLDVYKRQRSLYGNRKTLLFSRCFQYAGQLAELSVCIFRMQRYLIAYLFSQIPLVLLPYLLLLFVGFPSLSGRQKLHPAPF